MKSTLLLSFVNEHSYKMNKRSIRCRQLYIPILILERGKRKDGEAVSEETTSPDFYSAKYRGLPNETKPSLPVMTTLL